MPRRAGHLYWNVVAEQGRRGEELDVYIACRILKVGGLTTCLAIGGCAAPGGANRTRQASPAALHERITTARQIGTDRDTSRLAALVDLLDDEHIAVRRAAIDSLASLTGTRLGYYGALPKGPRKDAVARWRVYLRRARATKEWSRTPSDSKRTDAPAGTSNAAGGP